ncbi:MAG: TauD/TfdA family dioxygenase [Immundisolibacterales bacterium]|nr:TauD/TfdA family dioxygenase [Immundisolibacterales bacterium]
MPIRSAAATESGTGAGSAPPPVPECLDLSAEAAAGSRLTDPKDGSTAWLGADVDPSTCVVRLGDDALDEIRALAERFRAAPHPVFLRSPDDHPLDAVREVYRRVESFLDHGLGVAVIDRLPLDEIGDDGETARAVFWTIGRILARPVAQKWDGTMLYDVTDTGRNFGYGVRGSWTNVELVFHVDNAFGAAVPRYVGLMCIRPAREGGTSRFLNLHSLHDRLLERHPRALERLWRPLLFDRQAEHAPHAPRVAWAPVFSLDGGRLRARTNPNIIRKGYDVAGVAMDKETRTAVEALEEAVSDDDLRFEMPLERGQIQYLENQRVAHYRSTFTDGDDPAAKRMLVRMWHREEGLPTYEG